MHQICVRANFERRSGVNFGRRLTRSDARMAHVSPPPSLPQNKLFFFPMPIGRIERSTMFVSGSNRPSSRNRVRPTQRSSA